MRIVITGGGTGGHVFPAIAVAEELGRQSTDVEILFVGGSKGLEARVVPDAGYRFASVPARGLVGKRLLSVPAILWTTLRGIVASYRILSRFNPDVVFATGGYVSGSVALAGKILRKPLVLHEQNSIPGLTNRMLARIAQEVHLNLPSARCRFPKRRHLKLSGNPVRVEILRGDHRRARQEHGLQPGRRTVLILGGSQGARSINRASVGAVRALRRRSDLQFILQTGRRDYRWVMRRLRRGNELISVRPFIERMGDAYALADLVVARAGATTLAEITACGKPSILVPFPHAAQDHQKINAMALVEVGAAAMISDRRLQGEHLASMIAKLIDTPRKLREMSNNALLLARPEAAEKIAAALLRYDTGNGLVAVTPGRELQRPGRVARRPGKGPRGRAGTRRAHERGPRVGDQRGSHS
ncbi:MAG: undecaprenyldiphospho-muramoylpentapeptide beta-N-acetylglucosaminyltransferase [Candidatus Eisenbacteria sp.]|nr:undecaprenyldiphospho-muramoylpentapeptide beta-N-acetylglucosaminyltransferase [Candidatus Eisenbacteria bacterium]